MTRIELLQSIINVYKKKKYLEIGVSNGATFFRIKCKNKLAVDPEFAFSNLKKVAWNFLNFSNINNKYYKLESNSYFIKNKQKLISKGGLDLIFVDGMHTFKQSLDDILNSLEVLKTDGIIVVHDCYPPSKNAAKPRIIYPTKEMKVAEGWKGAWCGDVWKSIHYLSTSLKDNLNITVLDSDYGLGIITLKKSLEAPHKIDKNLFDKIMDFNYSDLIKNPKKMIHLQDPKSFKVEDISII